MPASVLSTAVVNNGRVVDQGTHKDLLSRGGFYSTLVEKQNFETMETQVDEVRYWIRFSNVVEHHSFQCHVDVCS